MTKPAPRDAVPGRDDAIGALVAAVASRPVDMDSLIRAQDKVRKEQGEGTLIESALVLGWMEGFTKVTDATGRKPLPSFLWSCAKVVFGILRSIYELFVVHHATK
jgi:hypothetical protein